MGQSHRTDWLYEAKWGVMLHYVYGCEHMDVKTPGDWNRAVDEFDVDGLAGQLAEVGAGYLLLTIAQMPPMNAPNSIFDKHVDAPRPVTTGRDLFIDVADALAKKGISLTAYSTYFAPCQKFDEGKSDADQTYPDWWPAGLAEYSRRWGGKVRGWWFDGQRGNEELNRRLAEAARAGNPDSLVAYNKPHGFQRNSKYEDYTAGDTPHAPDGICNGRWAEEGLQWHMLSFLAFCWGPSVKRYDNPRYTADFVAGKSRDIISAGGVVTWDVPPTKSGLIPEAYLRQLAAVGKAASGCRRHVRKPRS
ncbi:MAG TPA: alpha-L-fucosidase [Phycisphaerae bacterium]|nr:alpha-L-fucosidase [Phycisphaerae bacterium]